MDETMSMMMLLLFFLLISCVNGNFVRTNGNRFEIWQGDYWSQLDKFIGINLGVTPPGNFPGDVALRRNDYIIRFKRLEELGVNIVRVYALLHPEFYTTLLEWNNNHSHKFFVLHGTAFPEYQFEEINGTNAYNPNITNYFESHIKNTVDAVYGGGEIEYRRLRGVTPVIGKYNANIAQYLLGWVIGGEISPENVFKTNLENPTITEYHGEHISTKQDVSAFDCWMAQMMDYVAKCSVQHNESAPISHTNWVSTDGIKNLIEPRYPESTEDWQEIDQTNFVAINWEPGIFYNTHIYPYYPHFVATVIENMDPFRSYVDRLLQHYNDKPFLITEIGLSTSLAVSSYDDYDGRNHGGVSEKEYPRLMNSLLKYIIEDTQIQGTILFQLQDEWFKKTWNTENVGTYNRHRWRNVLSAEQNFGIFKVESSRQTKITTYRDNQYFTNLEVSNSMEFLTVKFKPVSNQGKVLIGLNTLYDSSYEINNLDFYKRFNEPMTHVLIIDLESENIDFKQLGTHDTFLRNYGIWLSQDDNLVLTHNIESIMNPDFGLWFDYKLLVKTPSYYNLNGTKVFYNHRSFTLEFRQKSNNGNNLALFDINDGIYEINIPYQALGIINPSEREVQVLSGQGNTYEIFSIQNLNPVKLEFSQYLGTTEIVESITNLEFNWQPEDWEVNFCEIPKEGFSKMRTIIRTLNGYNDSSLYTNSELTRCVDFTEENSTFLYYVTTACFIFLAVFFFYSSIVKWFGMFALYCYTFRVPQQGTSHRLKFMNLILLGIFFMAWYYGVRATNIKITPLSIFYFILIVWESFTLLCVMLFVRYGKWDISKQRYKNTEFSPDEHVFIVACHNSSDVLENTLKSLIEKVKPETIYVADNGSSTNEIILTKSICEKVSIDYFDKHNLELNRSKFIHYGELKTGNKSIAQYATVVNLPRKVQLVTCIDDDTRLDESWTFDKVAGYFKTEEDAVLAYPLKVYNPQYEIEYFQYIEYLNAGFVKLFHSEIRTTLFNSGAFGTYRKNILKKALDNHNANFHGDDLQICLNIHNLRDKTRNPFENEDKILSYKVNTATDIIATTIVPKCWIHTSSISRKASINKCSCSNPDLFGQRVKGWFLSEHRFFFRYLWTVFNFKDFTWRSVWIRLVIFYDAIFLLNQYFAIIYAGLFIRYAGLWLVEGLIIGLAFNMAVLLIFNIFFLKPNKLDVPIEIITLQPLIYKLVIVTIYKYLAMLYNIFIYTPLHRNGKKIKKRVKEYKLKEQIRNMYNIELIFDEELEYDDTNSSGDIKSFASSGNKMMTTKNIPKQENNSDISSGCIDRIMDYSGMLNIKEQLERRDIVLENIEKEKPDNKPNNEPDNEPDNDNNNDNNNDENKEDYSSLDLDLSNDEVKYLEEIHFV